MSDEGIRGVADVATLLGVSPTTVRRWATVYAAYLSPEASQPDFGLEAGQARRRFNERDVETLEQICSWRAEGKSAEEIKARLQQQLVPVSRPSGVSILTEEQERALSTSAAAVLAEALRTLGDNQQALMNSQQANRNLLGVVIQDNFNLKSENAKLRERLRAVETELAELKETDWNHRLSLEERLSKLEQGVNHRGLVSRILEKLL
jgi:DNA-binding transcriptional MerR regulator